MTNVTATIVSNITAKNPKGLKYIESNLCINVDVSKNPIIINIFIFQFLLKFIFGLNIYLSKNEIYKKIEKYNCKHI